MKEGVEQEVRYYTNLSGNPAANLQYDLQGAQAMLNNINALAKLSW